MAFRKKLTGNEIRCNLCGKVMVWGKLGNRLHFCTKCWRDNENNPKKVMKAYIESRKAESTDGDCARSPQANAAKRSRRNPGTFPLSLTQ